MSRILVVGGGAIGTLIAAQAAAGHDVTLIARNRRLRQLTADGLRLRAGGTERRWHVPVSDHAVGSYDIIIFAVKQPQLAQAATVVQGVLHPGTHVVLAMNGLPWWFPTGHAGADAALRRLLDPDDVLARATATCRLGALLLFLGATLAPDGAVEWPGHGDAELGWRDPPDAMALTLADVALRACPDVRLPLLRKLMGNACSAPLAVVTGLSNAAMAADVELRGTQVGVCREIAGLSTALGVDIDIDPDVIIDKGASFGPTFKASMLVDHEAGRTLELDTIVAAPCAIGDTIRYPLPRLATLLALVRRMRGASQRPLTLQLSPPHKQPTTVFGSPESARSFIALTDIDPKNDSVGSVPSGGR